MLTSLGCDGVDLLCLLQFCWWLAGRDEHWTNPGLLCQGRSSLGVFVTGLHECSFILCQLFSPSTRNRAIKVPLESHYSAVMKFLPFSMHIDVFRIVSDLDGFIYFLMCQTNADFLS